MRSSLRRAAPEESCLLAWPLACGSAVADRTRAVRFRDGVLYVEVADSGWRRELSCLAGNYLAAINKYTTRRVERIEFFIAR